MYYELTKISIPGFVLHTSNIKIVKQVLESFICTTCLQTEQDILSKSTEFSSVEDMEHALYSALPNSYPAMLPEDKISSLLNTNCGAEFCFDTYPDYDTYIKSLTET